MADKAVKQRDNYWTYANGSWNKRTEIAVDRTCAGGSVIALTKPSVRFARFSTMPRAIQLRAIQPRSMRARSSSVISMPASWTRLRASVPVSRR